MKKYLALFLALTLAVSLCGCFGGSGNEDVHGEINPPAANEPEFSLGKTEGSVYKNDFLGLGCTLPEGWEFYTDEQILAMNNITGEILDADVAEQLKNANIIYDMMAINAYDGSNINVNLEKFNALQILALDIKASLEAQMGTIKSSYETMGYTDVNVEYQQVTVDGKAYDALVITAKAQEIDISCVVFSFIKGNYMANVSVFTYKPENIDTLLGYFTIN